MSPSMNNCVLKPLKAIPVMEISMTTPALLFPAISLLLVAYTNRFNTIAGRIRKLHERYRKEQEAYIEGQIESLRKRVYLIKTMQAFAVAAFFNCVLCLFVLFSGHVLLGKIVFGISLTLMMTSLAFSFKEILMSVHALNLELSDMQELHKQP